MIETEDQRRWWFATHPEYNSSRRGTRNEGGVDPQEVDRYVDKALKYETGPVADLLKSVKRNFGTESQSIEGRSHEPSSQPAEDPAKEAFMKAFTDAGWSRERAEERWKVYKLNEGVARGVANAMTVLGAIAGARAILPGAYRWVTLQAGRSRHAGRVQQPTKSGPVFRMGVEPLLRESHRSAPQSVGQNIPKPQHMWRKPRRRDNRRS